jgi:hypothetical protein
MKLKKLGEFLGRIDKDHVIAAEFYNPGHTPGTDDRQAEINMEPGIHDISGKAKRTLGAYAESASNDMNTLDSQGERRYVRTSQDAIAQAEFEVFTKNDANLGSLLKRYEPGKFQPSAFSEYVSADSAPNGHNLLSSRVTSATTRGQKSTAYPELRSSEGVVNRAVSQSLEQKNLHAPGRAFVAEPGSGMEDDSLRDGMYSLQNGSFGKFDPQRKRMLVEDLNKATDALLNNARGINTSSDAAGDQIGDFLAPTVAPIQGVFDLRISNLEDIVNKFGNGISGQDDIARVRDEFTFLQNGGQTYGHLNTPAQPFNGVPAGMVATAFAGLVAMRAVFVLYQTIIRIVLTVDENKNSSLLGGLLPSSYFTIVNELGLNSKFFAGDNPNVDSKLFDLRNSVAGVNFFKLDRFFMAGFDTFYGYEEGGGISLPFGASLPDGLNPFAYKNVFRTPTYHATIARMILRDATLVTSAARDISSAGGAGQTINAVANVIADVATSFTFKLAINFVKTGIVLENESEKPRLNLKSADKSSTVNVAEVPPAGSIALRSDRTRYHKYRFDTGESGSPLSLRFYDSMMLRNGDVQNDYSTLLQNKGSEETFRFSEDEVSRIENLIDGEYIPFSFQDVRTNEILSLPAFVESVSDSFAVSYESTHGYGRTDPIHSYARTERSINFAFYLVAMSPEDHGYMYTVLNRLTAMCYPQRSAGIERSDGTTKFIQPFSQIPTASPLVRVRIGDLLRGNVVETSFFKIFGDDVKVRELENLEKIKFEFLVSNRKKWQDGDSRPGEKVIVRAGTSLQEISVTGNEKNIVLQKDTPFEITMVSPGSGYILKRDFTLPETQAFAAAVQDIAGSSSYVASRDIAVDFDFKSNYQSTSSIEENFYKSESNAVIRSFKSASGKGMAGFIKDMQLDYMNFNWGTEKGQRAPMGVKISISFAPIHDMPLGLDHRGRVISPTHPVNVKNGVK